MNANVIVFEAAVFILLLVFYPGSGRFLGRSRARAFLAGAVLFSLAVQTAAVLAGGMNFYWYQLNSYYKHYPLGGHIIWLGVVPLVSLLLWYLVAAISYIAASMLASRRGAWTKAAISGGIATAFYLLIEPIAVTNHWWTWNLKSFYFLEVPVLAWLAVFLSVFVFTAMYQLTVVDMADPKWLKKLEDSTIKKWPIKSKKITRNLSWRQLEGVFYFRLLVAFGAFAVVMAPLTAALWLIANRGQIPPGW